MASSNASPRQLVLFCTTDDAVLGSAEALAAVGYAPMRCASLKEFEREYGDGVVAVVLDADLPKRETFGIYRALRKEGKTPVLVLLPPPTADQPSWVMDLEHGEQEEFARKPITAPELVLRLNAQLIRSGAAAPNGVGFEIAPRSQAAAALAGYGKVICVFGAHGGVGKTTVAVHLARGLVQFLQAQVVLIDGDLWSGDSLVALDLTSTRTILDATTNGLPHDPEVWTHVLLEHHSGLKVLAPPSHLEDVERVPEGAVAAAAQGLRRYFDFVVVDLDDALTEQPLQVLEQADLVLVVMTPEFGSLRNTVRLLTIDSAIGLSGRVRVVLNRSNAGLEVKQVKSVIPRPMIAEVPSDGRLFQAAWSRGATVFEVDPAGHTQARQALEALVRDVAELCRPRVLEARGGGLSSVLSALRRKLSGLSA
ncbi:MAG: AAA family ATPase [Chloroflexi bacterium]|nr:AAA family ATPase [Chloroflexota bacterium]